MLDKPKGATGPGRRQRRSGQRLCVWSKASRFEERVPPCDAGASRQTGRGGVTQGRGGKAYGVPTRVTWEGDVARLARSDPVAARCTQGVKLRRAGTRDGDSLSRRRNITNPRTGSPVQHPGRVGEEQTVKVVQDHEGGARGGLATCLRSDHGDVLAGRGLLGSRDSGGAIFGNSSETSYDQPEGRRRERLVGRPSGDAARQVRHGGAHGAIRGSGSNDDDDDEYGASRARRA